MGKFSGQKRIATFAKKKHNDTFPKEPTARPAQEIPRHSPFAFREPLTEDTLLRLITWDGISTDQLKAITDGMPDGALLDKLLKKLKQGRRIQSDFLGPPGNRKAGWKRRSY